MTIFFRLLHADDKEAALRAAVEATNWTFAKLACS